MDGQHLTEQPFQPGTNLAPLLQRASAGDEHAWCELVRLYARRVFALAKSRVGRADVAEEVTQSVFATVAGKLASGGYTEQGRFEAWLFRVAINRVRDEIRRSRRQATATDPETLATVAAGPGSRDAHAAALLPRLREALAELGEADREVIELRHHGGLSFAQMSELLGEPVGTLLARHHRALKKLKDLIEPAGAADRETGGAGVKPVPGKTSGAHA
jgi:RNA polymerase sigma-70 factor (ECF subfamily)